VTGARAQFGRRPVVAPPAELPPAAEAPVAGRATARRQVSAGGRGRRGGVAFPALALAVVALTWMDAGVLRAEDATAEEPANEGDIVALPRPAGEAVPANDDAAAPDDGATETDEEEEEA